MRCRVPTSPHLPVTALALLSLTMLAACASRLAPFDELDKAQATVLRLQALPPPPPPQPAAPAPTLLPGIPPELQQLGQQALEGLKPYIPPGLLPPGLLPGPGPVSPPPPALPPPRLFRNYFVIVAEQPLMDATIKDELLDILGDTDSFSAAQNPQCFVPGMGVSFMSPKRPEPVDVALSLSCGRVVGFGFQWPHPADGFTSETHKKLTQIFEKLWGPVPMGGA